MRKAELKRRGITRYDAEILLAQGLELPEPKVVLERKIPDNITKNHSVKLSEFEGRQRLSPRKHLSSQSLLSMAAQGPLRRRSSPKKHLKNLSDSFNQGLPTSSIKESKIPENVGSLNGITKQVNESLGSAKSGKADSVIRHSPRLRSRTGDSNAEIKQEILNTCDKVSDLNLKATCDVNQVPSDGGRNIFSQLFEAELKGLTSKKSGSLNIAEGKRKLNIESGLKLETDRKTETNLTPEMPLLTPFDSETLDNIMKDGTVSENLQSFYSTDRTEDNDLDIRGIPSLEPSVSLKFGNILSPKIDSGSSSGKSKRVMSPKSQQRKSPRKKLSAFVKQQSVKHGTTELYAEKDQTELESPRTRLRCNSGQSPEVTSSVHAGKEAKLESDINMNLTSQHESVTKSRRQSKVVESNTNSINDSEQSEGPSQRTRSHSKDVSSPALSNSGVKKCDTNVFETFNSVALTAGLGNFSNSKVAFDNDEDLDIGCYGDGHIFETLSRKLASSDGKVRKSNGHFSKKTMYSRKRRLSFGGLIKSPSNHLSKRKKKFSLESNTPKRDISSRNIFSDLSPPKIPRITIKMPRDPVLVKELANQHSDGVQFKLESPEPSVTGTPDNSDSDSDEEESPLNCTKFKPVSRNSNSISRGGFSMKTSQFYSKSDNSNNNCPRLMRIKFGNTHVLDINIPQSNDRT